MIYKKCIMTIQKNKATLDEDIYLYRLDKNIELHFTIVNNKYKFDKSDLNNIIAQTNAAYFQIRLYKNDDIKYTFAIQATEDAKAILTITNDLIDDPIEVGEYDFQISLLDEQKTSMISMPIVSQQLHVCEPLVDNQAIMGKAVLGLTNLASGEIKNAFDSEGNYIREIHKDGDVLSASIINKFEEALETNTKAIKNGTGTSYDDTQIKTDINTIKTDLGTEELTTTAKDVKGAVNEVAAQYKDIANKIESGNIGTGNNTVEPELMDIPRIYFSEGTLPTSKTATVMKFDYYSKSTDYHGYVDIKCQGNSSMTYNKKNFTIKLYKEQTKTNKLKINFKGWGKQSKFVLKANWIDITHARNVVSARIWGDVIKTRSDYGTAIPELLRTSPNQGAIDGFPVLVYSNGVYQGRYTLNIPKDKWMSNMDDTLDTHCILCGENYQSGCFRALPQINGIDWTDELHDVVPASIKTSWTNAINFVMTSTDSEFKTNLSNYFDVNSLIDYYLYGLLSTNLDGFGKNQLFFTYDGVHWIASVYDLDSTWGLYWNGSKILPTNYARNQYEDYVNSTGNLLYNRLEQLFISQLKARYTELRKDVLSASHIIQKFEEFNQVCPKDIVQEDYASTTGGGKFTSIPSTTTNNIQQLRNNIVGRLTYVDGYINALQGTIPCTNIILNNTTLSFTTTDTQTLTATVTPTDTTDTVVWSVSPAGICSVNDGVVTPISNGECVVTATCGSHSVTCNVTVNLPVEAVTALSLDKDNITLGTVEEPDDSIINYLDATTWKDGQYTVTGLIADGRNKVTSVIVPYTGVYTLSSTTSKNISYRGLGYIDSAGKIIGQYLENSSTEPNTTVKLKVMKPNTLLGVSFYPNSNSITEEDYNSFTLKRTQNLSNISSSLKDIEVPIDSCAKPGWSTTTEYNCIEINMYNIIDVEDIFAIKIGDKIFEFPYKYPYSNSISTNNDSHIINTCKLNAFNISNTYCQFGLNTNTYGTTLDSFKEYMTTNNKKVIINPSEYMNTLSTTGSKFQDTLTATLTPANATNKNVTWTADNENVELVPNGLNCTVKAKAVGNSIVTCTSQDTTNGTISDTCNVTVTNVSAT